MIPILFNKDEKTFTSLGLGQMDATLVEVERERNGNYTLYAEVPFNSSQAKHLTKEMLIKADAGSRTKWQTFKINRTIKDTNADVIKVYADHISMDTINDAIKPKVSITQMTAEGALRQWANNLVSGKAYDVQSDITYVGSTEWTIDEVENARQALGGVQGSILDVWGGEYEFDNNRIILHKEMGRTAPTVLEYGRNIVSLEYEELIDGVYTSIYPYATYTPKSEDNKQLPDIMVTLDELIIDSEYAGNYETRRIQIVDFSGEFDSNAENPEIPTQAKLRTLAKAYVKNNGYGIPKISQEIDFVDLSKTLDYQDIQVMEEIELNDRVPVYYPNIDAETNDVKVTTTNWDVLNNRYSKITLSTIGAMNSNSITSKLSTAIKDLKAEQKKINNTVPYLINGQGNRVWWTTPDDNMEHKIDDTWFKKNGKYTIIYKWNGSMWEEVLNDETFITEIEAEVESAISKAEDAQALAVSEADKALTKAKADATAKANAIQEQISGEVNTAISTAEDAKALAVSESSRALTNANKYADKQDVLIKQQVNNSVDTAISKAEDAKQTAETSYSNAVAKAEELTVAQSTAFNKKFEENTTAMSTLSQATKDAEAKAKSALEKAGVNANLLDTHQNTLNTIKNTTIPNINKVAKDAMAEAKSALSSAGSAMDEAKKADGKIADYVTKNGLVSGTTVDSKINTATGEISKKITTVESKIDGLQVGGRNHFKNSDVEIIGRSEFVNSVNWDMAPIINELGTDIYYTVSFDIKSKVAGSINVYAQNGTTTRYGIGNKSINVSTEYQRFSHTFKPTQGNSAEPRALLAFYGNYGSGKIPTIKNVKFEVGNVATDWSPAPEDTLTQDEYKAFKSDYESTVEGITGQITSLSTSKLDGNTYTNFLSNDYKTTAERATSAFTKVNKVIDANGNSTDTFAKAVYDRNATRQSADFKTVTDGLVKTATYTAGINGLSSKITSVEGKIPTYVGGRNLLVARDAKVGYVNVGSVGIVNREHLRTNEYISIEPNTDYSLSGNAYELWRINWFTDNKTYISGTSFDTRGTEKTKTVTSPANAQLATVSYPNGKVKFEQGSVVTDWSLAPEDMATVIKTNEIERTADYSKMAITNLSKNGVVESSSVNATKDGITERVAKVDANGNISYSNRDVKLNSIVTTIADQNYISQQVQGSNIIQSTIADIVPAGANLLKNSDFRDVVTGVTFKGGGVDFRAKNTYPEGWGGYNGSITDPTNNWHAFLNNTTFNFPVVEFNETDGTRHWKGISQRLDNNKYAKVNPNASYMFSVDTYSNGTGTQLFGGIYYTKKGGTSQSFHAGQFTIPVTKANKWERLSVKVPLGSDVDLTKAVSFYIYGYGFTTNSYLYIKNVSLTEGDITAGWSLSPEDTATQSQVTQLQNSWSMKLKKADDVVTQINATSAGVLIQGKNIQLDGNVTMTSTFSVPNANIKDLAVNKITGTNAQFTTMITKGLTANVITSNMIKADDAMFTKLFATKLATDKLVAQGAWITNANIVSLDASKIKTGTIDAGRLNAGAIVTAGLSANVVKASHIESSTGLIDKIFANDALITRLTSNTIFASKIKAITIDASKITSGTIATARLNATAIVTGGLSANVVKSTHIESSNGLIDKIFANEAYIKRMTGKTAFISSIQAVNLSASRITSGTLDASKITVSNLDANSITANQASLVQAGFTSSSGGSLALNGDQILSTASDGSQTSIGSGRVNFRNPDGANLGGIGYEDYGASPYLTLRTSWGSHFRITARQEVSAGNVIDKHVLTVIAGKEMYLNTDNTYVTGDMTMQKAVKVGGHLSLSGGEVNQLSRVRFAKGAYLEEQADGNVQLTSRGTQLQFYQANGRIMYSDGTRLFLDLAINMQGNGVLNQSDERLKTDINYDELDSLSALMKWKHAGYRYINPEFNQERQFSIIAQSAPDLVVPDEDGYLQVNLSKQVNMTSHALQQHVTKTNDELAQLKAKIATLEKELALIKGD
ncbi:phage tail spike protein [Aerococcus viridans]